MVVNGLDAESGPSRHGDSCDLVPCGAGWSLSWGVTGVATVESWFTSGGREQRVHRPRQYVQIANAPKSKFFGLLAEGMSALAEHLSTLVSSAERCYESGDALAGDIVVSIAKEEAGKFLILLDAARIEAQDQSTRSSQLKRAGDHLAKSLYFEMSDLKPATLSEVERYFADARKTHYLDGPNDIDWVFRNRSLADREDAMYVDYQETDDGLLWHKPEATDLRWGVRGQRVFDLVSALAASGFADEAGLTLVHRTWSGFVPSDGVDNRPDTHWSEVQKLNRATVSSLRSSGFAIGSAAESLIVDAWTFPLHGVDLTRVDTSKTIEDEKRRAERALLWDEAGYGDIAAEAWDNGASDLARDMLDAVPADELDYNVEMARMRADYVREERQRFIDSDSSP